MVTGLVTIASITLKETLHRMYTRKDKSFEHGVIELAFSTAYIFLIALPCVRLFEHGNVIRFINSWGNLQVTNYRYFGIPVANKKIYRIKQIKDMIMNIRILQKSRDFLTS
jgi:hypothetical protein